ALDALRAPRRGRHHAPRLQPRHGRGPPLRPAPARARRPRDRRRHPRRPARLDRRRRPRRGVPAARRARRRPPRTARRIRKRGGGMTPRRTLATTGRVLAQIRHDPRTIGLLLVVPALLVGLIAWIFDDTPVFAQVGPAMLGMFPFIVMFLVTSITTLRERRSGTLERLLTLPLGKGDFIGGYALASGLLASLQAAVAVAWAVWVCGLEIEGSLGMLVLVAAVNGLLGTMLGLFASAFATTEFQVVQFMPVIVAPQVLLGGIFLARDQM